MLQLHNYCLLLIPSIGYLRNRKFSFSFVYCYNRSLTYAILNIDIFTIKSCMFRFLLTFCWLFISFSLFSSFVLSCSRVWIIVFTLLLFFTLFWSFIISLLTWSYGSFFLWSSFLFNNLVDDRIHTNENKSQVNGNRANMLFIFHWRIQNEFLVDNNRINNKTDHGNKLEQYSAKKIEESQWHRYAN